MKPFDLEAAKAGAPIQLRGGAAARFVEHAEDIKDGRVIIAISQGMVITRNLNGQFYADFECGGDIVMVQQKVTRYVSFYENGQAYWHLSEEDARRKMAPSVIAGPIRVEIEI